MSWPLWAREQVREFVLACTGGPFPQMQQQATRLLEKLPPEQPGLPPGPGRAPARAGAAPAARPGRIDKSALAFPPPFGGPSKRERRAARRPEINRLRLLVLARARGRCEFCRSGEPTDAHHVFGGADRTDLETEYTLAAVCGSPDDPKSCHGHCNASPAWAREQGLAWALRMAAANVAGADRGEAEAIAALTGFTNTAELLQVRIELAAAQARPITRTTTENT